MADSSENDLTQALAEQPTLPAQRVADEIPAQIGRYRVEKLLGRGGFGVVYLAHDDQLGRMVAVKVPHRERVSRASDVESYLTEARLVASLDHPAIVPVYDAGITQDLPCYVVSKYIKGSDLFAHLKHTRLTWEAAADLVATIAEALHYAHKMGLVHRDIKPSNILLDDVGRPYVVDFGLALRDGDHSDDRRFCGTPAYMSPEQARGEGHRVDGRSDIFSLGIVLYEILAGRKPFRGPTHTDLLEQVTSQDARPLRQFDETIPHELDRICQKAMAKRAIDRYPSAHDMAEDLRIFLDTTAPRNPRSLSGTTVAAPSAYRPESGAQVSLIGTPSHVSFPLQSATAAEAAPVRVIPKGLRAFDFDDAEFFPSLLPGPRDRNGLPEALRFWKRRIEERSADLAFPVGLIYGPSGCGKSSLVRAGLLPRLSDAIIPVVVEATQGDTEARLLASLRRRLPRLDDDASLRTAVAAIRRDAIAPQSRKVLIILDQFEQWLHANRNDLDKELVHALRQCDGVRVQCLLMVRDDFWLSVSRFLHALEINLVEGTNSCLADLFDPSHARSVLSSFGRALGKLPEPPHDLSVEQEDFLTEAVKSLTEDGRVICVRLALFSEMMKGRDWSLKSLKELGGLEGVGVSFLEETFASKVAPPEHRYHQKAARGVLRCLLPESRGDIRGTMKSRDELCRASGYESRPLDFESLLRILDSELRLITPTDPEGFDESAESPGQSERGPGEYYQLTHDYLVPSLRDWLNRKQRETRRGRAEILLNERAHLWAGSRENRYLPALGEWLRIRVLVPRSGQSRDQIDMMARTDRYYLSRSAALLCGILLASVATVLTLQGIENSRRALIAEKAREREATRVAGVVSSLLSANPADLLGIIRDVPRGDNDATLLLNEVLRESPQGPDERRRQLHAKLALVYDNDSFVSELTEEMLGVPISYVAPMQSVLKPYTSLAAANLEGVLHSGSSPQQRFRAGLALSGLFENPADAPFRPTDWPLMAEQIVGSNPESQPMLRDSFRPYQNHLLPEFERIFKDRNASPTTRLGAANAVADYGADNLGGLIDLLSVALPEQAHVLFDIVERFDSTAVVSNLLAIGSAPTPPSLGVLDRSLHSERQANAAIALLRLGFSDRAMTLMNEVKSPEVVTQFAFGCRPRGVTTNDLLDCLEFVESSESKDAFVLARYGLLLALGDFSLEEVPESPRKKLLATLEHWYVHDGSAAIHSAAGWLLRQWGLAEKVEMLEGLPVPYKEGRRWFRVTMDVQPADEVDASKMHHFTFVVIEPGEYSIGSPSDEPGRSSAGNRETRHTVRISRRFAMLDREIRFDEFAAFAPQFERLKSEYGTTDDVAAFGVNWFDAVAFCRWITTRGGLQESDQVYADPLTLKAQDLEDGVDPASTGLLLNWPADMTQRGFRLPTEAEWEIAARGGGDSTYCFGSQTEFLGRFAWFQENSAGRVHTSRQLRPSHVGLFDMHGNVFEWAHDWFDDFSTQDRTDPQGPVRGGFRVFRGGRWDGDAENCRVSRRGASVPAVRSSAAGFRLCVTLP